MFTALGTRGKLFLHKSDFFVESLLHLWQSQPYSVKI